MNDYIDSIDPNQPLLDQLVGENRPFKDLEALANSKYQNAIHSKNLEQEQAALRADLQTRINYEQFLEEFRKAPTNTGNHTVPTGQETTAPMTPQDIERIVEQREQKKKMESNLDSALSKYSEVNGPNSALKLKQQATELGMSEQQLKEMAAANPKLFYKATGLEETKKVDNFTPPPRTMVNSSSFGTGPSTNKEAQHWQELYRTKPQEYWLPANQNKIHKAVSEGRLDIDDIF